MIIFLLIFSQVNIQYPQVNYYTYLGDVGELQMKVSIWGEVASPGLYSVPEGTDIVTLLTLSGGAKRGANLGKIKIIRSFPSAQVLKISLKQFFKTGQRDKISILKPGDMVYVRRNLYESIKDFVHTTTELIMVIATPFIIYQTFK